MIAPGPWMCGLLEGLLLFLLAGQCAGLDVRVLAVPYHASPDGRTLLGSSYLSKAWLGPNTCSTASYARAVIFPEYCSELTMVGEVDGERIGCGMAGQGSPERVSVGISPREGRFIAVTYWSWVMGRR